MTRRAFLAAAAALALTPRTSHAATLADMIEALYLGSGPASPNASPPIPGSVLVGWPSDAVTVVLGAGVPAHTRQAIHDAAAQIPSVTYGRLTVAVVDSGDLVPWPRVGDVTFSVVDDPRDYGYPEHGALRWVGAPSFPGELVSARIVFPKTRTVQAAQHDVIGHGVLGLRHVNAWAIGGMGASLMSVGDGGYWNHLPYGLTAIDLSAIRAVWASGLAIGATREEFIAAGLIAGVTVPTSGVSAGGRRVGGGATRGARR